MVAAVSETWPDFGQTAKIDITYEALSPNVESVDEYSGRLRKLFRSDFECPFGSHFRDAPSDSAISTTF